jgi:hypothetical protein
VKQGQIIKAITDAAIAYGKTGEPCHLDRIKEMVSLLESRESLKYAVTRHAVQRFKERTKCKSDSAAEATLRSFIDRAEELELKDR